MTKADFKHRYPNGENLVVHLYKKCLYNVMTSDEIDKIIRHAKGKEKRFLKAFKKLYTSLAKDWDTLPFVVVLDSIESPMLFKDVITYMAFECGAKYDGADEE